MKILLLLMVSLGLVVAACGSQTLVKVSHAPCGVTAVVTVPLELYDLKVLPPRGTILKWQTTMREVSEYGKYIDFTAVFKGFTEPYVMTTDRMSNALSIAMDMWFTLSAVNHTGRCMIDYPELQHELRKAFYTHYVQPQGGVP